MKWFVQIKSFEDGSVVKEFEATSEKDAYQIDGGLSFNLDHERYYTVVVSR